jgi:hypothetical protein
MTDIREWARTEGYEIGVKGRIPGLIQQAYDAAHPSGNGSTGSTGPDYPDDDFDAAFPGPEPPYAGLEEPGGTGDTGETRPRPPRGGKGGKKGTRPSWLPGGGGGKKRPGKKQPRVSTEDLLGALWRGGAKLLSPVPPLQRTLRMQAPVAGMLLDDVVKDSIVDPVLQPLARLAAQGKTVQALVGPPAFVTAIMAHQIQRANLDPPQEPHPLFMAVATEGLRTSLMAWMEVAGPKFEVALSREQEFESKYGQPVDDMIAFIFSAPVNPADVEAVMAEEEAIKRAQGVL